MRAFLMIGSLAVIFMAAAVFVVCIAQRNYALAAANALVIATNIVLYSVNRASAP